MSLPWNRAAWDASAAHTVSGGGGGGSSTATLTITDQSSISTLVYGDFSQNGTSGGTLSGTINTGTASANRRVIVGYIMGNSYDAPVTSLTDSGSNTWTIIAQQTGASGENGSFKGQLGWAWADIATGTTITLTFHGGTSGGNGELLLFVFTTDKTTLLASPVTNFAEVSSGTSAAPSLTTGSGGFTASMLLAPSLSGAGTSPSLSSSTQAMTNIVNAAGTGGVGLVTADYKGSGVTAGTWTATYGWTNSSHGLASLLHWR